MGFWHERVHLTKILVETNRVGSRFCGNCLDFLHGFRVEDLYDRWISNGHVKMVEIWVMEYDVRSSRKLRRFGDSFRFKVDLVEATLITGAKQSSPMPVQVEPVGSCSWNMNGACYSVRVLGVKYGYLARVSDVHVEPFSIGIEDSPSCSSGGGHIGSHYSLRD